METVATFHDPTKFPSFVNIPLANQDAHPNLTSTSIISFQDHASLTNTRLNLIYHLLGTISENMTLGTNPTFVCKDRDNSPFAVTIKLGSGENFDAKACRKGYMMAIRGARKFGVKEGKQGFVETSVGMITVS
jgi:hypothetical protein